MYQDNINNILLKAFDVIHESVINCSDLYSFTDPEHAREYVASLKDKDRMGVILLNSKHKLIKNVGLYKKLPGDVNKIIKKTVITALKNNAAALIFYDHDPNRVEKARILVKGLTRAFKYYDIKLLDYIAYKSNSTSSCFSFASMQYI